MLCKKPYLLPKYNFWVGCNQCIPCRINRRRNWVSRMILESLTVDDACFVTLTYDDEHNPRRLEKSDLQNFFKRLRKHLNFKIRYYACGEYGEKTKRPHYHAVIFGLSEVQASYFCRKAWTSGFVYVGSFTPDSASYVAGYVCKKLDETQPIDWNTGELMTKEYSTMSRRPGLGVYALSYFVDKAFLQGDFDVISYFYIGSRRYTMPRFLRQKLRQLVMSPAEIELAKELSLKELKLQYKAKIYQQLGFLNVDEYQSAINYKYLTDDENSAKLNILERKLAMARNKKEI